MILYHLKNLYDTNNSNYTNERFASFDMSNNRIDVDISDSENININSEEIIRYMKYNTIKVIHSVEWCDT